MSDEFDREEEKRKLREKYAKDQQDREVTGRMSDLLLQGATMTNKHCDRCGSPIFRQNDEEFCPTCRAEDTQAEASTAEPRSAEQDEDSTAEAGSADHEPEQGERVRAPAPATGDSVPEPSRTVEQTPDRTPSTPASSGSGSRDDARAALADSVATLARRAADADDPRRAKEYLEAAREAADALAALD